MHIACTRSPHAFFVPSFHVCPCVCTNLQVTRLPTSRFVCFASSSTQFGGRKSGTTCALYSGGQLCVSICKCGKLIIICLITPQV